MQQRERTIRIGRIDYANVWPVFHHFVPERYGGMAEIVTEVPTGLNRALSEGDIDLAAISSFAYGEASGRYLLLPDLSVSAYGRVGSILLFHRKPLAEVARGTVALTTASATSVNLLKIILEIAYGGAPTYVYAAPSLETMMNRADAALLIGDDAIRAGWRNTEFRVTDLGECWKVWTGKWMTFAVWAVREDVARERPAEVAVVNRAFQESKRAGLADPEPIVRAAYRKIGGEPVYWRQYFANLSYDFRAEQQEGLSLYFRYAAELGLLPAGVPLRIWSDTTVAR